MKGEKTVIDRLNAQLTSELTAADQYFVHSRMYRNWGLGRLHERLEHVRGEELEQHAARLIERILFLEGTPDVAGRAPLKVGRDVKEMLENDLSFERAVVTQLRDTIALCEKAGDYQSREVLAEMGKHGLVRGERGLEVWVMCEIPNNVVLAADFCEIFDGFSVGSNDLTQLTLGVDRDSEALAHVFDERDPGVKRMIELVVEAAHRKGRPVGICGQAPSDYPDFAAFLVELGIDSISLNPDSIVAVTRRLAETRGVAAH